MFSGVDKIGLKEDFKLTEIVVICANDSDESLVQNCHESYVVENGSLALKKKAKKTTSSNKNKGVEKVLKTL
jgi:hydroxymethylpyrimidine pyrophosphatase-like HAD family hydrolase